MVEERQMLVVKQLHANSSLSFCRFIESTDPSQPHTHPPRTSHPTFLFLTLLSLVNPNISNMWQDGTRHPNPIPTNTLLLEIAHKQFTYKRNYWWFQGRTPPFQKELKGRHTLFTSSSYTQNPNSKSQNLPPPHENP